MDKVRSIEFAIVLVGAMFTGYFTLDSMHANRVEFKLSELHLKKEMITNELNRDHFARRRYEQLISEDRASESDLVRYDYLALDIRNKESEKKLVEEQIKKFTK